MSGVVITAAVAQRRGFEPTADAKAIGMMEHRVLINLTPEVDSLVEWVASLQRHPFNVPGHVVREGLGYCRKAIELNSAQDHHIGEALGFLDEICHQASRVRTGRAEGREPSIKEWASRLRPPLRRIRTGTATASCYWLVGEAIHRVEADRLLSDSMRKQLGVQSFELLAELHAEAQAVTA